MKKVLVLLLCALALSGCAVRRLNSWNDEDAAILARELAADIVNSPWLREAAAGEDRTPALLIAPVENRSGYSASASGLEAALSRELLLSGKIRLIRPRPADDPVAAGDSLSPLESGADGLLQGWLEVVPDPKLLIFRLTLRIQDPETGQTLHQSGRTRAKPRWLRLESDA
ncbi:MAG: hypothetical protein PHD87_08825 [Candidatus Cloacimonetes bacterium]|nr:hypothetical protein [Candidatus Cloacimonadota bacterium]